MAGITHICTHCGYEGKPIKPPGDEAASDGESTKALERVANLLLPGMGFMVRPLAWAMVLPIYLVLWPIKRKLKGGPRHCPNCGLPLMVPLSSDEGWLAKRKLDIKTGAYIPGVGDRDLPPPVAFGKEVILPGDEVKQEAPPPPRLERLPSLGEMLEEKPILPPVEVAAPQSEPKKTTPAAPAKKPDPEAW